MRNATRARPQTRHAQDDAATGTLARLQQVGTQLTEQLREHPMRTIGLAFGAGYVLGGGLFSSLTARLLGLGATVGLRALSTSIEMGKTIDGKEMTR